MDPEFCIGCGHFGKKLWRNISHINALLKHLECCVECSIHFIFIFLSNLCDICLNTNFCDTIYYRLGAMAYRPFLNPRLPAGSPIIARLLIAVGKDMHISFIYSNNGH